MAMPAMVLRQAAANRMGADSLTIWRSTSRFERQAITKAATLTAPRVAPTAPATGSAPTSRLATHRAGRVSTSPRVDTRGAVTLSRSQS